MSPEGRDDDEVIDLSALPCAEPPPDFADRVLSRIAEEPRRAAPAPRRRRRGVAIVAGGLALAAGIAGLRVAVDRAAGEGETIAQERTEVSVGPRARAVLEPGAVIRWKGDDVVQSRGDVFYRVEPGATFRVHTPAGDVDVRGTCFAVKVRKARRERPEDEASMSKRDVKAGLIGAGLSALAFVAVYEGKVAVSHAKESALLSAGESAKLTEGRIERTGTPADGEKALAADGVSEEDVPLVKANENLAAQVSEYRRRLEHVAAQRAKLEEELAKVEAKLSAERDGAPPRTRNEYDLDSNDWAELAKNGEVRFRVPCLSKNAWTPTPAQLDKLGLAPDDAVPIKEAYQRAYERLWPQIRPICQEALGSSSEVVEKIGSEACAHLVYNISASRDGEAAAEAHTAVAEIRAGLRPEPGPNEKVHPITKMFLAFTGAMPAFEADLARSFGPEEAHRLVYAEGMCMTNDRWGGGKKRDQPKR